MKKQYIIPEMEIYKMQITVLQSASNPKVGYNLNATPTNAEDLDSRGFSGFGDDEE